MVVVAGDRRDGGWRAWWKGVVLGDLVDVFKSPMFPF